MSERRGLKRRHLIYYLSVFEGKNDRLLGYLVDITPEGFMVMSEKPISASRTFETKINRSPGAKPGSVLPVQAKCLWSRKDQSGQFYDTGFQILDPDEDTRLQIELLIKALGFRD